MGSIPRLHLILAILLLALAGYSFPEAIEPAFGGLGIAAADRLPAPGWTTGARMPTPRQMHGVAVLNGKVFAIGGHNRAMTPRSLAVVEAYDPIANRWSPRAPMPTRRQSLGVVATGGLIYAVGGYDDQSCPCFANVRSAVEAYDPVEDSWTARAPLPTPRFGLGVVTVRGIVYAIGGRAWLGPSRGYRVSPVVEAYDPATNAWVTRASMPTARTDVGIAQVGGVIYVIGGMDSAGVNVATVEAYDTKTDRWVTRAPMPTARGSFAATVMNGVIYATGGFVTGGTTGAIEAFDPSADAWATLDPMPRPRAEFGVAASAGVLFAVGGDLAPDAVDRLRLASGRRTETRGRDRP